MYMYEAMRRELQTSQQDPGQTYNADEARFGILLPTARQQVDMSGSHSVRTMMK